MTTIHDTVADYLKADSGVSALVSTRVYVDTWLPQNYKISDGNCIVITPRGGGGSTYYVMANQTLVIRAFATTIAAAFAIDGAVFDALEDTHNPANNTAFYAKDTVSPTLNKEAGGMFVVSSSFQVAEVL